MIIRLFILFLMICISGWGPFSFFFTRTITAPLGTQSWINEETKDIDQQVNDLNPDVLKIALIAYIHARTRGIAHTPIITIIDYSKPSSQRRLWVIDLNHGKILFDTWVTHGKNSGEISANSFSNQEGSLKSSIGVFLTASQPYVGEYGYALRIIGLEKKFNDNAYKRSIVFHGAWYADPNIISKQGGLGRSWGCPAVSEKIIGRLINTIRDKTLVVVYYPDRRWLNQSTFLGA